DGLRGGASPSLRQRVEEQCSTRLGRNHDITLDVRRSIYEAAR
ncbi:NADH-dependent alcohol dehydrogenase, partial [Klebsiella pneumoniae]|nr:NADH-dependent alcohol dehydrogenase [Klebsiella pneumoniae]